MTPLGIDLDAGVANHAGPLHRSFDFAAGQKSLCLRDGREMAKDEDDVRGARHAMDRSLDDTPIALELIQRVIRRSPCAEVLNGQLDGKEGHRCASRCARKLDSDRA